MRGHVIERKCEVCGRIGCDKCLVLHYVRKNEPEKSSVSEKVYGWHQYGCCSHECYRKYWEKTISRNYANIMLVPYLPIFEEKYYYANLYRLMAKGPRPTPEDIIMLSNYLNHPLAQGITMMYNGYKALEFDKITDGLRICRNDDVYEINAKRWVDNLAMAYIQDLKRFDVPTKRAELGGVTIALSVPSGQSKMRLHACPSCGAVLEKVAIRGQTVKCEFCASTFEIT